MRRWILGSLSCALASGALTLAQSPPQIPVATLPEAGYAAAQVAPAAPAMPAGVPAPQPIVVAPAEVPYTPNPYAGAITSQPTNLSGPPTAPAHAFIQPGIQYPVLGTRVYANIEYTLFSIRNSAVPPLAQVLPTDAAIANPPNIAAAQTVYGGDIDFGNINGVKGTLGLWLFGDSKYGIEVNYLQLEKASDNFYVESAGLPVIGRYFYDVANPAAPDTFLFRSQADGSQGGFIKIDSTSKFYTVDLNARVQTNSIFADRTDILYGLRYASLDESVVIDDRLNFNNLGAGNFRTRNDTFEANNAFYGAQIGINSIYRFGAWQIDATGKLGIGGVKRDVSIRGDTRNYVNNALTQVVPGGILTQPTNIGDYSSSQFAVMPEIAIKLGYRIRDNIVFNVGWDFLAISSIQRAGAAIDQNVNSSQNQFIAQPGQVSNENRPAFNFSGTDFWAQGLTLGLTFTY